MVRGLNPNTWIPFTRGQNCNSIKELINTRDDVLSFRSLVCNLMKDLKIAHSFNVQFLEWHYLRAVLFQKKKKKSSVSQKCKIFTLEILVNTIFALKNAPWFKKALTWDQPKNNTNQFNGIEKWIKIHNTYLWLVRGSATCSSRATCSSLAPPCGFLFQKCLKMEKDIAYHQCIQYALPAL